MFKYKNYLLTIIMVVISLFIISCPEDAGGLGDLLNGAGAGDITGTLTYEDIVKNQGIEVKRSPTWAGEVSGQEITYSISPALPTTPTGYKFDATDGSIIVPDTSTPLAKTIYNITAEGKGEYTGTLTGTIQITIKAATLITGTLTYADFRGILAATIDPTWTSNPTQTVEYSVATQNGYAVEGISIGADGTIALATTIENSAEFDYTEVGKVKGALAVKVVGTGTFGGTIKTTANITITDTAEDKDISQLEFELKYEDLTVEEGFTGSKSPTGTIPSEATLGYTLKTAGSFPAGITLDAGTGTVTVGTGASAQTKTGYTIVAKPTGAGYTGTKEATINITIGGKDVSAYNFNYEDTEVAVGVGGAVSPKGDIPGGAAVEYTLKTAGSFPAGITLNPATGVITIAGGTTLAQAATEYTIVATPGGGSGYTGVKEAIVKIAITSKDISVSNNFSYDNLTVSQRTAAEIKPKQDFAAEAAVEYKLKAGSTAFPAEITLNAGTGVITITDTALAQAPTEYTIVATPGGGSGYTGVKEATVKIEITSDTSNDVSTMDFSYDATSLAFGTGGSVEPKTTFPFAAAVKYELTVGGPFPAGISIGSFTGIISIAKTTAVQTEESYTIKATPENIAYTGTKTATAKIRITEIDITTSNTFSYAETTITTGTAKTVNPEENFSEEAKVEYTLKTGTFHAGITLDKDSGVISIADTALPLTITDYVIEATSTGAGYKGTKEATIKIKIEAKSIAAGSGSEFSYSETSVVEKITTIISPITKFDEAAGIKYTLKAGTFPAGIILNEDNGIITILGGTAVVQVATEYTIVATPNVASGYVGNREAIAKIKISSAAADITEYNFSYTNLAVEKGSVGSVSPTTTFPVDAGVEYTIVGSTLPSGISIEKTTGKIQITAEAELVDTAYNVLATPKGGVYGGTKVAIVNITVAGKNVNKYNFTYKDIVVEKGGVKEGSPMSDIPQGANVRYTVTGTFPGGISIDNTTGKISIGTGVEVQAKTTYTIVATPTAGTGYTNAKSTSVRIEVTTVGNKDLLTYTFSYVNKKIPRGTSTNISPEKNFPGAAGVKYAVKGTGFPPGIELNADSGVISVAETTEVQTEVEYTIEATPSGGTGYRNSKEAKVKIEITSSDISRWIFKYNDTSTDFGTAVVINPEKGFPDSAAIKYELTLGAPFPLGISVSSMTGDIIVAGITPVMNTATYTITATSRGVGFNGTKSATVNITVNKINVGTDTFRYANIEANVGVAATGRPEQNFNELAGIKYTLKEGETFPNDITLNADTGVITVGTNAVEQAQQTYTIEATPDAGSNYKGAKEASIKIKVDTKDITSSTFTYDNYSGDYGATVTIAPDKNFAGLANVRYEVTTGSFSAGINFDTGTGEISITAIAPVHKTSYTITATPGVGSGYIGSKTAVITIEIKSKNISEYGFIYRDKVAVVEMGTTVEPEETFPVQASIGYVLSGVGPSLPSGIRLSAVSGIITITNIAAAQTEKTYTITARPTAAGYHGTKNASVKITITKKSVDASHTFTYDDIEANIGVESKRKPRQDFHEEAKIQYTLKTTGGVSFPNDVTLNVNTGEITVGINTTVQTQKTYTIVATPDAGSNYKGSKEADVKISIDNKDITSKTLTYNNYSAVYGATAIIKPDKTFAPAANVGYAVTPSMPLGINFDTGTGEISIGAGAGVQALTSYTITATPGVSSGYIGTKTAVITIEIKSEDISGKSLTYPPTTLEYGKDALVKPNQTFPTGSGVTYEFVGGPIPSGIEISALSGNITIDATAAVQLATNYTIKATANSAGYQGTKNATASITITPKSISSYAVEYAVKIFKTNEEGSVSAISTIPRTANVKYELKNGTSLPSGISLNENTGKITIASSTPAQNTTSYDIVVTPRSGNYKDIVQTTVSIVIVAKSILDYQLTYPLVSIGYSVGGVVSPSINTIPTDANVKYAIKNGSTPLPSGMTLDENTGKITISATQTQAQFESVYIIIATPTNSKYGDTKRSIVKITIPPKSILSNSFAYNTTQVAYGVGTTVTYTKNFPSEAGIRFKIKTTGGGRQLPTGITLNANTGKITISATEAQSQTPTVYIVEATAYGNYGGTKRAIVQIEIIPASIAGYTFNNYSDMDVVYNIGLVRDADNTFPNSAVRFTATLPNGIVLDANTGVINILKNANANVKGVPQQGDPLEGPEYTITATGIGNFKGTKTATVKITIRQAQNVLTYFNVNYSYSKSPISFGSTGTASPFMEKPAHPDGFRFVLKDGYALGQGLFLNANTGVITIGANTPKQTNTEYRVIALPNNPANIAGQSELIVKINVR